MSYLSPQDVSLYNAKRSRIQSQFGIGRAQNQYDRGQLDLNYGLQRKSLGMEWDRQRTQLPGQFARSGMLNSGVYQRALQDYAQGRGLAFEAAGRTYQQQLGQLGQRSTALSQTRTSDLNVLAAEEQARRSSLAASLRKAQW
jgi:hypothetical protein